MTDHAAVDAHARILWNYMRLDQPLTKSDAIFILGCHDPAVAQHGADLFLAGWAPWLIISGGVVHPPEVFNTPHPILEADHFAHTATQMGVPPDSIILEKSATNTGENFNKTAQLLGSRGHQFQSFIVVQKPYMERRTFATAKKHWPDNDIIVASSSISYDEYITSGIPFKRFINTMVGDLQRIKYYPERGFQIYQEIPDHVWQSFEILVELGYDERLIS